MCYRVFSSSLLTQVHILEKHCTFTFLRWLRDKIQVDYGRLICTIDACPAKGDPDVLKNRITDFVVHYGVVHKLWEDYLKDKKTTDDAFMHELEWNDFCPHDLSHRFNEGHPEYDA